MYAGHFAAALALKAVKPEAPTWALVAGTGALDVAFGFLVASGAEGFAPDFAQTHVIVAPWSHSLAGACVIGAIFAAAFGRRSAGVALALFAAVLSHWLLDLLVHRPDMSILPNAAPHLGYFAVFGPVSGWAETLIVVMLTALYAVRARQAKSHGRHWGIVCALMAGLWGMGLASG